MTRREKVYLAALAGLLHDVGKFAQRAGWRTGRHADVGGDFVAEFVPQVWREHLYPVMGHHDKPLQDHATKVVALADRLSAGERAEERETQPKQLLSIFCRLEADDQKAPAHRYWPLRPLALEEQVIFPQEQAADAYDDLWREFSREARTLQEMHAQDGDLVAYLESLLLLMGRYTWCVPSAYYRSLPDVSLYDHSRTTAALAACFVDLDEAALDAWLDKERQDEPLALLVGGDLSGVQDFIYTITAKGAAKGLRGRSFYLQLLTEAVARYTLRRLGLPVTNLLYVSGGHFYLLAPARAEADLQEIRAEISGKLLDHHQGDLYLALGWTEASAADFQGENFGKKWRGVSQKMNAAKRQRFAELDKETLLADVFAPYGEGGDAEQECQVCHYYGPEVEPERDEQDARRICPLCDSLEQLGTQLREADYLLLAQRDPQDQPRKGFAQALAAFGLEVGLTAADGSPVRHVESKPERTVLLALRDLDGVTATANRLAERLRCPVAFGTRYTVNVTPRVSQQDIDSPAFERYLETLDGEKVPAVGDVKEFGLLQEQAQGVKRLGVLRMDVDDLGDLFRWSLGENATLSRVVALSSALALFFEGWVGQLCRAANQAAGTDKVYAIYSGGDDLFIVGAWDLLPGLAHQIRQDLARLAADNPLVHLSGGLTLHGGKYPLYQAADDAESALDTAKDLVREDGGKKDAFNFLDLTIPWERYGEIVTLREELEALVKPKEQDGAGVPRALVQTLGRLYARYRKRSKEAKTHWGPWMWRGAWNLTRLAERHKEPQVRERIVKIRDDLKSEDYRYLEIAGPAARWAELLTRKEQEK